MGRLQVLSKKVDLNNYDCKTCMDKGEFMDTSVGRRRPCPDCPLGRNRRR